MSDAKYWVAVIGAGPAGLFAARKLAEEGGDRLCAALAHPGRAWTEHARLPGGDLVGNEPAGGRHDHQVAAVQHEGGLKEEERRHHGLLLRVRDGGDEQAQPERAQQVDQRQAEQQREASAERDLEPEHRYRHHQDDIDDADQAEGQELADRQFPAPSCTNARISPRNTSCSTRSFSRVSPPPMSS